MNVQINHLGEETSGNIVINAIIKKWFKNIQEEWYKLYNRLFLNYKNIAILKQYFQFLENISKSDTLSM